MGDFRVLTLRRPLNKKIVTGRMAYGVCYRPIGYSIWL